MPQPAVRKPPHQPHLVLAVPELVLAVVAAAVAVVMLAAARSAGRL
jgi:hypothetical protein